MKGLLIKDIYLMKEWRRTILILAAVMFFLLLSGQEASFILGYGSFIALFMGISTISYDEADHGYSFLMTLPVSRELYVLEKYCMALLCGLAGWLAAGLLCGGYLLAKQEAAASGILIQSAAMLGALLIFLAVILPVQLKFGSDKGRIAMFVLFMGVGLLGYFFGALLKALGVSADKIGRFLENLSDQTWMYYWIPVILVLLLFLSYRISCGIMRKKEL